MVALSGSLAHLNLQEGGDLDLFVVTRGRHAWTVCVALIVLARLMGRRTPSPMRMVGVVAWPAGLADWEARETARSLAKLFALLYLHGPGSAEAADLVREVRPADRLPAFCVPVESEIDAVRRVVKIAASGDELLLVGARSAPTLALLESFR